MIGVASKSPLLFSGTTSTGDSFPDYDRLQSHRLNPITNMRRIERPPRHNPYDTFTSQDLDDFVTDIRDKVTLALKPPPRDDLPCLRHSRSSSSFFTPLKPHSHNQPLHLRPTLLDEPVTANGKGKARALDEGPGVKGLAHIAPDDRRLTSSTQSPVPQSGHSEVDTDDGTDHPVDDSLPYQKYYHAKVEREEEEVDGETDDDREEMYDQEEYVAEYGDQDERASSVGHSRRGRDYREDDDGAIVIDSDDEGDELQGVDEPGLSMISPEWGESYEDGEHTFEEDEDFFRQETVTGNIESQIYDEDPQLDELDDENQITIERDGERRDDAVFDSEDQDVLRIGRDEVMGFHDVTGSGSVGSLNYDVSEARDEAINATEDPVYESMFGTSHVVDIPPPHLPPLSFPDPVAFSAITETSNGLGEQFSIPNHGPEISQIDPDLFGSATYPMPMTMPYTYAPPAHNSASAGLWALDSLVQAGPAIPNVGSNSEWLDQVIFDAVQRPPTAAEGMLAQPDISGASDFQGGSTSTVHYSVEGNQTPFTASPHTLSEGVADKSSVDHVPHVQMGASPAIPPASKLSKESVPTSSVTVPDESTATPVVSFVDEALKKIEYAATFEVYEIDGLGASLNEGPSLVEEPPSREDPYPDYLSVRTATTEEPMEAPDIVTVSHSHLEPVDEDENESERDPSAGEPHLSDNAIRKASTENIVYHDLDADEEDYGKRHSSEEIQMRDLEHADAQQDEESHISSPQQRSTLPDEQSDADLSLTQPDTQDPDVTQTLAPEEAAGTGRESADIDGMAVDPEAEATEDPEEISLQDDPFTHMGTGKGGPGETFDEDEGESDSMSTSEGDLKVYGEDEEPTSSSVRRDNAPFTPGEEIQVKLSKSRDASNSPSAEHPDDGMEVDSDGEGSDHTSLPGTELVPPEPPSRSSPASNHYNLRSADTSPSKASSSSFLMPPDSPLLRPSHGIEMPPPPVARLTSYNLYRHHHGPLPPEHDVPLRSRQREDDRTSQVSGPSVAASRISTSQVSLNSPRDANAPVTRSHCRFHRIAIPTQTGSNEASDDEGRTYFIVPGCSLAAQDVIKEEGIEICGEASKEQNDLKIAGIESLPLDADVVSILRKMVGHEVMVTACAWLPSESQAREYRCLRQEEHAAALKAASFRHPRRKSGNVSLKGKRAVPNLADEEHPASPTTRRGSAKKHSRVQHGAHAAARHHSDNEIEEPDPLQSIGTADEEEQSEDLDETASVDVGDNGTKDRRLNAKRRHARKSGPRKIDDKLYAADDTEEEEDDEEHHQPSKRRRSTRRNPKTGTSASEAATVIANNHAENADEFESGQNLSKKRVRMQAETSRKRRKQDAGEDDSASLITLDDVEPSSTANSMSTPAYPKKNVEVEVLLDPPSHHLRSVEPHIGINPPSPDLHGLIPASELTSEPGSRVRWWNPFR